MIPYKAHDNILEGGVDPFVGHEIGGCDAAQTADNIFLIRARQCSSLSP